MAAIATGFAALFIFGIGYGCQTEGGGTNCDVIVGVSIAFGAASVALFVWMFAAAWRLWRERHGSRPSEGA